PNLVRLRLGNSAPRNRFLVDLSLSVARWTSVSEIPAANFSVLAFSLARFSDHGRRGADQNARGRVLARFDLHVLSLRNAADPKSDQPFSPSFTALVSS